jgi:FMN phosphatase YigB (HAD superfamily)
MRFRSIIFDLGDTLIHQQIDTATSLDRMSLVLIPGVPEALEWLVQRYLLGVLSNTTQTTGDQAMKALTSLGIGQYFTACLTSVDMGYSKPDQRLFQRILQLLCTSYDEAIMIGNDLEHDIRPACSLGITTGYFVRNEPAPPDGQLADFSFSSFSQLRKIISDLEEEGSGVARGS